MSKEIQHNAILLSLQPLFEKAEAEGLWFYHESEEAGEVWASPQYLKYKQSKGRLIWAPEHWELRDPMGYMRKLHREAVRVVEEYNDMAQRLNVPEILMLERHMSPPEDLEDMSGEAAE